MINIKKLKRPTKRSGFELKPGQMTKVKGVVITNTNSFSIHIDKYSPK